MRRLDWKLLKSRYSINPRLVTKTGEPFSVARVTDSAVYVELQSGRTEYISRANLEKAVDLLNRGERLQGPKDYRDKVYDQRPAYAWAILRDMGLVS